MSYVSAKGVSVSVDDRQVRIGLGDLRSSVTDVRPLLNIAGEVMRGSIARTFREEGSPAGSWPKLAISTLRKKKYTSGHMLLVMRGILRSSFTYAPAGNTLTIGTNVVYAAVHQFGSRDYRGGFTGPMTKEQHSAYEAERVTVEAHKSSRIQGKRYGTDLRTGKDGKVRRVRVRLAGPQNRSKFEVGKHQRHQNIPARPFLVFRPEDPQRIADEISSYLSRKVGAK
jgi:phage gpG-like protein